MTGMGLPPGASPGPPKAAGGADQGHQEDESGQADDPASCHPPQCLNRNGDNLKLVFLSRLR